MSDQPEDQTPDPDLPEAGDSTPEPKAGGTPPPDFPDPEPEPEVSKPASDPPEEPREEVSAAKDFDESLGEAPAPGQGEMSESDDRTFGMLAHLLGAFTCLIGPIIIWVMKKEESPFVDDQGREAVNWQIGVGIAWVVFFVLMKSPNGLIACFGWLLLSGVALTNLIFCILACVEANKGVAYRYPYNLRLIK